MDYSPRLLRHSHLTDHTRYPEGIHANHPSSTHLVLRLRRVQGTRPRPADFHSPRNSRPPSTPPALASLYNYPTHISDEILRAYSQLRGHAFLPHQALKEFWAALDGASPVPAAAERVRSALASSRNPARRTQLPLECAAFRHAPAGPLHRTDHADSRTHHRHRINQRGTPRRRHDPAATEPHLHRTRGCRAQPRTP